MGHSVIHIGANKTATTTLQRRLFSVNRQLQYLGDGDDGYGDYVSLINSMVNDDDLFYLSGSCAELFKQNASDAGARTLLFSSEDVMTSHIPLICAKRLKVLMPKAEVVLVVRNQQTAIPSFYANHGAFLKPAPPSYFRRHVEFDDWISFQAMFSNYGALASFKYDQFESIYSSLFDGRFHVLMFEEFINNRLMFMEKLSNILRIDTNKALKMLEKSHERPRFTGRMLAYNKFRTSLFWGTQFSQYLPFGKKIVSFLDGFLAGGTSAKIDVSASIKQKIHNLYCDGNSKLAEKYRLPLAEYDYPTNR